MNYDIFRDELGLKHPAYGHALWEPDPGGLYNSVEVGDVGFIRGGRFHRLFNALLPRDHPSQNFGVPEHYERLELNVRQHICTSILNPNDIYSKGIRVESGGLGLLASGPEPAQVAFSCLRRQGAILSLPVSAQCADTIALGDFAKWIVKHIDVWFAFAQNLGLGLSRMEEIVFVTGRHLARSSINVVFSESQGGEQVSYGVTTDSSGANLEWQLSREDIRGVVFNCGPSGRNLLENQCIFVRGFRVTRFLKILPRVRGAASPTQDPDGPEPEFEIQLIRIPANTNYQDPLHTLLEYLTTNSPECDMALIHDDDLMCIDGASLESLQPDAVISCLQDSKPEIYQVRCNWPSTSEDGSEAETLNLKVATLYKYAFESQEDFGSVPALKIFFDVSIAASLIRAAKNVQIYRLQCDELTRRCLELASTLRDRSDGLEGRPTQRAVDEVESVLARILLRMQKWAEFDKIKSFVQQTEIKQGLDESYRELQSCSAQFYTASRLHASHRKSKLDESRRRDHHELVEMITEVLRDQSLLKIELASSTPEDARGTVHAIELELKVADVGDAQGRQLQEDLEGLRGWVERLSPLIDLTKEVVLTGNHAIATGGSQDIYTGELNGQKVALAYPRNQSRAAQEYFQRQVEIWRTLRHPNILPLLGIAHINESVYSVSPYMEFGNTIQYLKDHPEVDRVLLLKEIASAMEYLHMRRIIHGDLQGSNILISEDGHACLGDFGSAHVDEETGTGTPTYRGTRWLAPELIADSGHVSTTRATDVWSFGMLCIEIFTEDVPFGDIMNEMLIPVVIHKGLLPTRPENRATDRGLSDGMWNIMTQCWQRDPTSRPSMTQVREAIHAILHSPSQSGKSLTSTSKAGDRRNDFSTSSAAPSLSDVHPVRLPHGHRPGSTALGMGPLYTSLPFPTSSMHEGGSISVEPFRLPNPTHFSTLEGIPEDVPVSSSAPSKELSPKNVWSTTFDPSSLLHESQIDYLDEPPKLLPSPFIQLEEHFTPSDDLYSSLILDPINFPPLRLPPRFAARPLGRLISPSSSSIYSHPDSLLKSINSGTHMTSIGSSYLTSISSNIHLKSIPSGAHLTGINSGTHLTSIGSGAFPTSNSGDTPPASISTVSLLDAAVQDTQRTLRRSADGTVEAGTLEGLVDYMLKEIRDRNKDDEVTRVFLATYRLFITDENLFRVLKGRFEEIGISDASNLSTPLSSIHHLTLLFLRTWICEDGENMGRDLLISIRQFAISVDAVDTAAQSIIELADKKMVPFVTHLIPRSQPSLKSLPPLEKVVDIAISLSVIEGDLYDEITRADYIAYLRGAPISEHIKSVTQLNNRIYSWVKKRIHEFGFQHFIRVAEECRKLQNFSSMSAIVTMLQRVTQWPSTSTFVHGNELNSEEQLLHQLGEVLNPSDSHKKYREALQDIKPSAYAIPWLAVHLRDLKALYKQNNIVLVVDQRPLINFSCCARVLECIDQVRRYRSPPMLEEMCSDPRVLVWVKNELQDTLSDIPHVTHEAPVAQLSESECQRLRDSFEDEIKSLGLLSPSH